MNATYYQSVVLELIGTSPNGELADDLNKDAVFKLATYLWANGYIPRDVNAYFLYDVIRFTSEL